MSLTKHLAAHFRCGLYEGDDIAQAVLDAHDPSAVPPPLIGLPPRHLQPLVEPRRLNRWFERLVKALTHPAETAWVDGRRCVHVLGLAVLAFDATGTIATFIWELDREQNLAVLREHDPARASLDGLPWRWAWLDNFRAVFVEETEHRHGVPRAVADEYAQWVFTRFRARLGRGQLMRFARRRVAEALALDADLLDLARRIALHPPGTARVAVDDYNQALEQRPGLTLLRAEAPKLVAASRILTNGLSAGNVRASTQPAAYLRRVFVARGVKPATWRLVHRHGLQKLAPLAPFYRVQTHQMVRDWLLLLQLMAARRLPPVWFLHTLLSLFGDPRTCRAPYYGHVSDLGPELRRITLLLERADAAERAAMRTQMYEVLRWIARAEPDERLRDPRRAAWSTFVRCADAWRAAEEQRACADPTVWPVPFRVLACDGLQAVALTTPFELWHEGRVMRHCAASVQWACQAGTLLVFSIRDALRARPLATLGVRFDGQRWSLSDCAGPANSVAKPAARRVAQQVVDALAACRWRPPRQTPEPAAAAPRRRAAQQSAAPERASTAAAASRRRQSPVQPPQETP